MRLLSLALASSLAMAPIAATSQSFQAKPMCGADTLQHLVGASVNSHDFTAHDGPVRIIPPNSAVTMDHRLERLNVGLDYDNVIMRVWCG